jgi:hypothetical protein
MLEIIVQDRSRPCQTAPGDAMMYVSVPLSVPGAG